MSKREVCITTIDNPYNPFDNFDSWLMYDIEKGYSTLDKLDRLTETTKEMSSKEELDAIEKGIDRLIEIDPLDIYKKVVKED